MRKYLYLSLVFTFFLAISCASVSTKIDYDTSADFSSLKTFKLYDKAPPGDKLVKNPLLRKRVFAAIKETLISKGYVLIKDGEPDFFVVAHAGLKNKTQVTTTRVMGGYGWYDPWYGRETQVYQYEEATLVIDIVNMPEKEMIWKGIGKGVVRDYTDPKDIEENVKEYVTKILGDFPPDTKN